MIVNLVRIVALNFGVDYQVVMVLFCSNKPCNSNAEIIKIELEKRKHILKALFQLSWGIVGFVIQDTHHDNWQQELH
jgi:hypothetical protein